MRASVRLFFVALLLWAGAAYALVPIISGTQYKISDASGWHESREASCEAFWATFNGVYPVGGNGVEWEYGGVGAHIPNGTGTYCRVRYRSATGGWQSWLNMGWTTRNSTWCPANSTASGGACACNSGYHEDGNACVANPTANDKWKQWCQDAASKAGWFVEMPGRGTTSGCQNLTLAGSPIDTPGYVGGEVPLDAGCTIAIRNAKSFPDADGTWYTQGDAVPTGGTCRPGDVAPGDPEGTEKEPDAKKDPPCVGGYVGEVSGTSVCAKPDPTKGVDWTGQQTTTNPDGSKTTTDTQTSCSGTTCTTTTTQTTTNSSGTVTGTSTSSTTESHGSLCARDKGNGACSGSGGDGNGASFSGSCASGFKAVSDDPVINAMAEDQHRRHCQTIDAVENMTGDWVVKSAGDVKNPSEVRGSHEEDAGGGNWTSWVSQGNTSAACPQGFPMELLGETYTLSFQPFCDVGEGVRPVVIAVALLFALRSFLYLVVRE